MIGLASALYIGASFGAGPRDSLMLAIVRRGPRISVASWAIQIGALTIGFAFGGSVGIGTVLFALGLGPCIEGAYWVLMRLGVTRPAAQRRVAGASPGDRGYVRPAGTSAPPASSAAVSDSSLAQALLARQPELHRERAHSHAVPRAAFRAAPVRDSPTVGEQPDALELQELGVAFAAPD